MMKKIETTKKYLENTLKDFFEDKFADLQQTQEQLSSKMSKFEKNISFAQENIKTEIQASQIWIQEQQHQK